MGNEAAKISMELTNRNRLFVACENADAETLFRFCFYRGNQMVDQSFSQPESHYVYWPTEPGEYWVRVQMQDKDGGECCLDSDKLQFAGLPQCTPQRRKRENMFLAAWNVVKEVWENRVRMWRIAVYDNNIKDKDSYLGKIWSVLNPLIQVLIFWLVFGVGFRHGAPVNGDPYIIWMLCGLIPWFFINAGIVGGAGCVYVKANTVLKFRYPMATIPVSSSLSALIDHALMLGILLVVLIGYGCYPNVYWFNLLYYLFFAVVFLSALGLITSTLTMLARDFQKLILSLIRLLFYMTPILWQIDSMPEMLRPILRLNPVLYIVDGYRESLLYHTWFFEDWKELLFFWVVNLGLLLLGSTMHRRLRSQFADMI